MAPASSTSPTKLHPTFDAILSGVHVDVHTQPPRRCSGWLPFPFAPARRKSPKLRPGPAECVIDGRTPAPGGEAGTDDGQFLRSVSGRGVLAGPCGAGRPAIGRCEGPTARAYEGMGPQVAALLLVAVFVVLVIAVGLSGVARQLGADRRLRQARLRFAEVLADARGPQGVADGMRAIAATVSSMPAPQAAAHILAARATYRREVAPVLVAGLSHADAAVASDAERALTDQGAPGLRLAWQWLQAHPDNRACADFLLTQPDWLCERLLADFASRGESTVQRHAALWRSPAMRTRLDLLRTGSDAINAQRAAAIQSLLERGGGQAA